MPDSSNTNASSDHEEFDYSTPEGQRAMTAALGLILEIREDETGPLARKVALYEKTLGLAVIPVLIRRAFIRRARGESLRSNR